MGFLPGSVPGTMACGTSQRLLTTSLGSILCAPSYSISAFRSSTRSISC